MTRRYEYLDTGDCGSELPHGEHFIGPPVKICPGRGEAPAEILRPGGGASETSIGPRRAHDPR